MCLSPVRLVFRALYLTGAPLSEGHSVGSADNLCTGSFENPVSLSGLKAAGGEPGQEGRRNQARRQASIGLFRLETSGIRLLDGYLGFRVFGQRF